MDKKGVTEVFKGASSGNTGEGSRVSCPLSRAEKSFKFY